MKQTIEIEVPDGKTAVWKDGRVYFIDNTPKLPKTWEEYCETNPVYNDEYYIGSNSKICSYNKSDRNDNSDRNLLATKEAAEAHLAFMQLHRLRDCYRQGWTPSSAHTSFVIDKKVDNSFRIEAYECTYKFLSFQSQEITEEFLTNFEDLIEQAKDLI